ncbi:MAG TPA: hypothetical protein VHU80_18865 [Polyangiaceae bacterium]|jgi:hypothetical protein|nr:hypothetical protein [Polyangiaceae bacterium]
MQKAVRRLLAFIALAVVAFTTSVHAQTITLPVAGLYRKQAFRPLAQLPNWINRDDCVAEDVLSFYPVTLDGYAGDTLQVWAGDRSVDCSRQTNRTSSAPSCWLLDDVAATAAARVDVSALDLVARTKAAASTKDAHGLPSVCTATASQTALPLSIYFLLIDANGAVAAQAVWNETGVDVVPPSAPTAVSGKAGDTRIALSWTPSNANDVRSYRFYCDPAPGTVYSDGGLVVAPPLASDTESLSVDAATFVADASMPASTDDAGVPSATGSGGASSAMNAPDAGRTCSASSAIVPGSDPVYPNSLARYACGSVPSGQSGGTVTHLVDLVDYSISVAAVDQVGNVGVFSNQVCAVPAQLTDFFQLYRQAGGRAGGVCSLSRPPMPVKSNAAAVALVLGLAALARRRRHSNSRR